MSVEIVLKEDDLFRLRKVRVGQILVGLGKVHGGMSIRIFDMSPTLQRGEHHEQVDGSITLMLVVCRVGRLPSRMPRLPEDRRACFGDKLLRAFVQADQRDFWVCDL